MPNRLSSSFSALSLTWETTSQSPIRRPIGRRGISAPVPRRSIKKHQERHTKQAIHAFERIRGWSCSSPEPFIPVSMPFLCVPSAPQGHAFLTAHETSAPLFRRGLARRMLLQNVSSGQPLLPSIMCLYSTDCHQY